MKRFRIKKFSSAALILVLVLVPAFTGCGGGGGNGATVQYQDLTANITPGNAGTVEVVEPLQTKSVYNAPQGHDVQLTAKPNPGYRFDHWEGDLSGNANPATLTVDSAKNVTAVFVFNPNIPGPSISIPMRNVPGPASFPVGIDDSTSPPGTVDHAYQMAETEVTYEQWYAVKTWATENGYAFANLGTKGDGNGDTDRHPVTSVNWRDAIVWCNALTEYYNAQNGTSLECAYKNGGVIVKDATDTTACDGVSDGVNTTGFRLPTSMEWELAARYRGSDSVNAVEYPTGSGIYWTKGNSASGATAAYTDAVATKAVAWYSDNSGSSTNPVATTPQKNALNLCDMSGNVWEWCFDWDPEYSGSYRVSRGGGWMFIDVGDQQLGYVGIDNPGRVLSDLGFRPVRTQ